MNVDLVDITKRYGQNTVINKLNISFQEGGISCLMGPSGAGKTTIVNLLAGLLEPEEGSIRGMEGKKVSVVFQEDRLIEHWNAVKNIRLVCDREISQQRILAEMDKLGLSEEKEKPVKDYSGGMRRRVAIIRALLSEGEIIVMDEPFRGLDIAMKQQVIQYIKTSTVGKTVIIVTHDSEDVELLAAKRVVLSTTVQTIQ